MTEQILRASDIDPETGKKMYEVCQICNYDAHHCFFCGSDLTHSGHDSEGNYHDTAYCRPDLVEHEPGPLCTWPDRWCYWDHDTNTLCEQGSVYYFDEPDDN